MKRVLITIILALFMVPFVHAQDIKLSGSVSAENNQLKNVSDPTDEQDAATKKYVDSNINSFSGSYSDLTDKPTTITTEQASAITANTAKTGITTEQADAITANTAKTGITIEQANAITANTEKTGITTEQANAITANTAKNTFPGFGATAGKALEGDTALFSGSYNDLSDKPSLSDIEGVISTAKLDDNAVTSAKIQDGTIATADVANAAITNAKLDDNAVNSAKIIDGSIVNADVNASAAIAGSKIAPDFGSQNIKTTGNVSIGTDQNWDAPLSIASDNPNIKLYDTGNGGTIWRIDNGTSGNGKLTFRDGNTPKMIIANNGEVQLNSTGDYALHTTGDSFVANTITSYRDDSGDHAIFLGRAARGSNVSPAALQSGDRMLTISARGHNGSDFTGERAGIAFKTAENWTSTAQGTYIDFFATTNGETGSSSKMTITNDGKVGIGTTSPAKKLEVNGDIQVSSTGDYALHTIGDSFVANTITSYRDESGDHAMLLGRAARGSNANPTALQSGDRMLTISARGYDGSDFKTGSSIAFETSENWTADKQGSIIDFITTTNGSNNSAVRMRINKDGKVGIGTDNPAYALDIADTSTGTAVLAYKQGDNDKWGFSSNLLGTQWINLTNNKTLLEISAVNGSTTVRANLNVKNGSDSAGQLNMYEDSDEGVNKVTLQAPALSQDVTLTLPNNDGNANQVLLTDGNGVLSWVNASTTIGTGDITADKLADNAVTSAKIQDGTIATADVADAAITSAKLATDAVTSAKILDGTIVNADIADAAITTNKIADGSVETIKLAADAVTSAKILNGTIATADVADAAITNAKLATDAVTSAKILDGTIQTIDINDGSITFPKLANELVVESGETTTASDANIFTGFNMMKRLPFGARIYIEDVAYTVGFANIDQKVETIWKISSAQRTKLDENTKLEIIITNTTGYSLPLSNYTVSLTYEALTFNDAQMVDDLNPPVVYDRSTDKFWIKVEEVGGVQDAYLNIMIFPGEN